MAASIATRTGHVVQLLERWPDPVAPAELPIRPPMRTATRWTLIVLLLLAAAIVAGGIAALWTWPTPGWWFSALFTVVMAGLVLALLLALVAADIASRDRARAIQRWSESADGFTALTGRVAARTVSTIEDGRVDAFQLAVETENGTMTGGWERAAGASPHLLQTQLPGIGATARVWSVRGRSADWPLVIQVLDPSVVDSGAPAWDHP